MATRLYECTCGAKKNVQREWNHRICSEEFWTDVTQCFARISSLEIPNKNFEAFGFLFVQRLCKKFMKERLGESIGIGHFCSMRADVKRVYAVEDNRQAERELSGAVDVFSVTNGTKWEIYLSPYCHSQQRRSRRFSRYAPA